MKKLLILSSEADQYQRLIAAARLPDLHMQVSDSAASAADVVADCEIILGEPQLVSQVLAAANRLRWVQSCWAGVDSLCQPGLRRDYLLTGVGGQFGRLISEYITSYLFALERGFFEMRANQLERNWQPLSHRRPRDLTVGIIGLGSIGQHLAKMVSAFGFRITGMNTSGKPCPHVAQVYTQSHSDEFFAGADYVVVTLPATPQTKHFINARALQSMRSSAVLMNVGRGSVVDEAALIQALQENKIRAAVLDVFETEPLPSQSPLWGMPNVYVTPHVSAMSFPEDIVEVFKQNYLRYLSNESLPHVVDFERGY